MRVAALYDIHGNFPALEAVLDDVNRAGVDLIVLGGDMTTGPMTPETLDLLMALGERVQAVRGNCERDLIAAFDGHDLAQELAQRGPLPVEEAVGYMLQACEALAEAHACGIVHRDLKPANLFLAAQPDGSRVVKVLDFGVSKAATNSAPENLALTQDFAMIGSPLYMSPEQMRSAKDVDARSDIWALGVIAFELLAGRPPYLEDSIADLVRSMLEPPPSLRGLRPEVSEALEQTILRCLQRNPQLRYADVGLFAQALSRFAPEMRALAERARRVLGNSEPRPSGTQQSAALISTVAAETSHSGVSAPPTVTAWGEHHPRERRPIMRRAGIASLLLLTLGGLGFGLQHLPGSNAAPSASAPPGSGR